MVQRHDKLLLGKVTVSTIEAYAATLHLYFYFIKVTDILTDVLWVDGPWTIEVCFSCASRRDCVPSSRASTRLDAVSLNPVQSRHKKYTS